MFNDDYKLVQRMAPLMQKVLIVDPAPASARLLAELMRNIAPVQLWNAVSTRKGLDAARQVNPQMIFVELQGQDVDGVDFARQLRKSDIACRMAPVIMITATATPSGIMAARDAGVHEFLRKPYTAKDLLRRLEAVTLRPRDWVEAVQYIGPDRRRFNSGDYTGPLKRRSDAIATTDEARIIQALKILKSAVPAVTSDPRQAMRAMMAQMVELHRAANGLKDLKLAAMATDFQRYLAIVTDRGVMDQAEIAREAAALLTLLPSEDTEAGQAA
ncbi:response regulator [Phenylobacterium sp.]|uniref:response regulator n=1 Tax=Phenylobacterium sp. TaxID=1871053 RepID=UPI002736B341|nr:response regulator [Phenylobacterium sp.]MDP3852159.1 response regulator [Phenylobacterium sp.]